MTEEVLDFVRRRFSENCHWLDGNCYFFAVILCSRFPFLDIYYAPIEGHFVAGYNGRFYDWRGEYVSEHKTPVLLSDIEKKDPAWYRIIVRDCIM